ncbi:MAG: 16S rRNA (guanine(527)-N(7))-methyltransferase RsmG [Paramuribaculum sp.]|nr:16S rRNA (guanine(527)-N(7))-methyltransferase RsmG [Paramuribaculum sp.]
MEEIIRYFPELTETQRERFAALGALYSDWNAKINVISRKDIDNLYVHHVLHSLAIAKFMTPAAGSRLLDMGCGGGFPGIPLAILWPDCHFHLIDRIGKKLRVAQAVADAVGLPNVSIQHGDIGECREKFDFVVSRAVMTLDQLVPLVTKNIAHNDRSKLPDGLICLKGGDLKTEIDNTRRPVLEVPVSDWFSEEYFSTKKLLYVRI